MALTTYQAGHVVLFREENGTTNTHFRGCQRPMGLALMGLAEFRNHRYKRDIRFSSPKINFFTLCYTYRSIKVIQKHVFLRFWGIFLTAGEPKVNGRFDDLAVLRRLGERPRETVTESRPGDVLRCTLGVVETRF